MHRKRKVRSLSAALVLWAYKGKRKRKNVGQLSARIVVKLRYTLYVCITYTQVSRTVTAVATKLTTNRLTF